MNGKFDTPHTPTELEQAFIQVMQSRISVHVESLTLLLGVTERELRYMMEDYNNFKFAGYTPQGEIHCSQHYYELIKPSTPKATKYQHKAYFNAIKSLIAWRNSKRILGEIQLDGQLDFTKLENLSYSELHEVAKMMEGKL